MKSYLEMYSSTASKRRRLRPELLPLMKCFWIMLSVGIVANSAARLSTSSESRIFRLLLQLVECDGNKMSSSLKQFVSIYI